MNVIPNRAGMRLIIIYFISFTAGSTLWYNMMYNPVDVFPWFVPAFSITLAYVFIRIGYSQYFADTEPVPFSHRRKVQGGASQ
jgi:hypothetical protein